MVTRIINTLLDKNILNRLFRIVQLVEVGRADTKSQDR